MNSTSKFSKITRDYDYVTPIPEIGFCEIEHNYEVEFDVRYGDDTFLHVALTKVLCSTTIFYGPGMQDSVRFAQTEIFEASTSPRIWTMLEATAATLAFPNSNMAQPAPSALPTQSIQPAPLQLAEAA